MEIDFQELYLESINRIKEKINFNYKERERQKTDEDKKFYDGIIMGLFECLDMMRSDFIIANDEDNLAEVGLDFEPFEKMDSGTFFDDVEDNIDYIWHDEILGKK